MDEDMSAPQDQAFPSGGQYGVTKREYYAAAALQGLLARANGKMTGASICPMYAQAAFDFADAMMKHTERTNP